MLPELSGLHMHTLAHTRAVLLRCCSIGSRRPSPPRTRQLLAHQLVGLLGQLVWGKLTHVAEHHVQLCKAARRSHADCCVHAACCQLATQSPARGQAMPDATLPSMRKAGCSWLRGATADAGGPDDRSSAL
jgi:hypothetical protein